MPLFLPKINFVQSSIHVTQRKFDGNWTFLFKVYYSNRIYVLANTLYWFSRVNWLSLRQKCFIRSSLLPTFREYSTVKYDLKYIVLFTIVKSTLRSFIELIVRDWRWLTGANRLLVSKLNLIYVEKNFGSLHANASQEISDSF